MSNVVSPKSKQPPAAKTGGDALKWLVFWILVAIGLVANTYYQDVVWSLRAAAGLLLCCLLIGVAATTRLGRKAWGFVLDARLELRKVVWPTRAETMQTLLLVLAMVVAIALVLWALDSFLMWAISHVSR